MVRAYNICPWVQETSCTDISMMFLGILMRTQAQVFLVLNNYTTNKPKYSIALSRGTAWAHKSHASINDS